MQLSTDSDAMKIPLPLVSPEIINVLYGQYFTAASRGLRYYCTPLVTLIVVL